jgi:hypothetical protein
VRGSATPGETTMQTRHGLADVTYRAMRSDRSEVALKLRLAPDAATVVDAWQRLKAIHADVDPRSLEVEIRETAR